MYKRVNILWYVTSHKFVICIQHHHAGIWVNPQYHFKIKIYKTQYNVKGKLKNCNVTIRTTDHGPLACQSIWADYIHKIKQAFIWYKRTCLL